VTNACEKKNSIIQNPCTVPSLILPRSQSGNDARKGILGRDAFCCFALRASSLFTPMYYNLTLDLTFREHYYPLMSDKFSCYISSPIVEAGPSMKTHTHTRTGRLTAVSLQQGLRFADK
jgi:hypothetical protein